MEKIIKYNKNKTKEINKIINSKKKYKIDFIKDNKIKLLCLFDENKKLVLSGNYNFFGIYQLSTKLWIWGSSIPGIELRHIKNIQKLKNFNYLFENNNTKRDNFYYQLLTQDVLLINNNEMLNWIF